MMQETVFTIGHSTHPQDRLIALLVHHNITAVCDIRSKPYSRLNPQFNREEIKRQLRSVGLSYVFLGNELGARSPDPSAYEQGKVQYERLALTDLFQQGLARVREGLKNYRIALMCAEKEPLDCHRSVLVARHLARVGIEIQHIHADGRLESHAEAMERLLSQLNLPQSDMFRSHEDVLEDAYRIQEGRIAYAPDDAAGASPIDTKAVAG
jgi:uncharacterized protein (DUF488 family)